MDAEEEIFQESPRRKAKWLEEIKVKLPVGTRVRVRESDVEEYIYALGVVEDYDTGSNGEWPTVRVRFDPPIPGFPVRDGFYDDELETLR